uniref:Tropomodulin n=1 Tax=Panagrolaimus superbus TaxID=310955 RepID=A0A914Y2F7_9BILA
MADEEEEFEGIMTDEDFEAAIDELRNGDNGDMSELLKIMNENQMISWDEAERIMGDFDDTPIKSSLPPQTRPTEPENDTNVDEVIRKLLNNDPKLLAINMNNMKRTPVPQIKRIIEALRENTYCEKLCLANMGLYDNDIANVIEIVEASESLKHINVETNYLSGDFFAKLFQAALNTETLEEVKAVNQGVSFATTAEKDIIKAITSNTGLLKVSINLRLPEGRHKIENATIRNQDIRRELRRRQRLAEAAEVAAAAAAEKKVEEPPKELPRRKSRAFVAPIGAATSPKITPKPEPDTTATTTPKVPMRVYRKQSIPTTDPEATSSAASSKPASPIKKAAPAVEEKKPAATEAAATTTPATRKWGRKEPEVPETKKAEPEKPVPRKWGRKEPESDASETNNKSDTEKPATKNGAKNKKSFGAKSGAKPEVKPINSSLKTKTDSSDAEKPPSSSANEEDGEPKKKKIIKKKIIVKKIVKKKKPTPNESEADEKTATESEREETAPTPEEPPKPAPAKKIPPPVLPKSGVNRFGSNLR